MFFLQKIIEKRKELHKGSYIQYELVTDILDEIVKKIKKKKKQTKNFQK